MIELIAWIAYIVSFPALLLAIWPIFGLIISMFVLVPIFYFVFEEIFPDLSCAGFVGVILFGLYIFACGHVYPWAAMVLNK